jgi:hypothetical protein
MQPGDSFFLLAESQWKSAFVRDHLTNLAWAFRRKHSPQRRWQFSARMVHEGIARHYGESSWLWRTQCPSLQTTIDAIRAWFEHCKEGVAAKESRLRSLEVSSLRSQGSRRIEHSNHHLSSMTDDVPRYVSARSRPISSTAKADGWCDAQYPVGVAIERVSHLSSRRRTFRWRLGNERITLVAFVDSEEVIIPQEQRGVGP